MLNWQSPYGIEFSSEESSKILFDSLKKASKTLNATISGELDDEMLDMVTGGSWKSFWKGVGKVAKKVGIGAAGAVVTTLGVVATFSGDYNGTVASLEVDLIDKAFRMLIIKF